MSIQAGWVREGILERDGVLDADRLQRAVLGVCEGCPDRLERVQPLRHLRRGQQVVRAAQ